ncbi:MAG: sphingomyelin phosphodiesterase [Chitinophagales bacterium]|nr:sphingomyelin phosphodiesterase [Chitinophagales bacterium]MDW8420152.1 sphingomyelin phosphodiesterase [Chitinophagales bacterium]
MKAFIFNAFFLILAVGMVCAQVEPSPATGTDRIELSGGDCDRQLNILSWNIYMLPKFVPLRGRISRAHAIVDTLLHTDYDIIVFQEAFLEKARRIISEGLRAKFPYQYGPANPAQNKIRTNSGVYVISSIPLKVLGTIEFRDKAGPDAFARKGAIMLEGEWNCRPFQILGTHLQADAQPRIRKKQFEQLFTELILPHRRDSVVQIICGDMNTEREFEEAYCDMLHCLDAEDGELSGIHKYTHDSERNEIARAMAGKKKYRHQLDYVLVRTNGAKIKSSKRVVTIFTRLWKAGPRKKGKDLSDHYGVAYQVKF